MNIPTMEEMLKAGVHFGHQASRWHPKMQPYIYTTRNGIHIIDLKKTSQKLQEACDAAKKMTATGGDILFVGTKTQASAIVEEYAKQAGMPYIHNRWIGGLLTNFGEVKKSIRRYLELLKQKEEGAWEKYTKKEQVGLAKELEKLQASFSGIAQLNRMPAALFVVDMRIEKTAIQEAGVMNIPVIAIADTNTNPLKVQYPIPANDDATRGLELVIKAIAEACAAGVKERKIVAEPKGVPKKKAPAVKAPVKEAAKA